MGGSEGDFVNWYLRIRAVAGAPQHSEAKGVTSRLQGGMAGPGQGACGHQVATMGERRGQQCQHPAPPQARGPGDLTHLPRRSRRALRWGHATRKS